MSGIYAGTKYDQLFQEELVTQTVKPGHYSIDNNTLQRITSFEKDLFLSSPKTFYNG